MYRYTNSLVSGLLATVVMTATLLPLPPNSESSATTPARYSADFKASVMPEDNSQLAALRTSSVLSVRDLMASVCRLAPSGPEGLELTRGALGVQYPGLVSEQTGASYYVWEYNPETGEYEQICCSPTEFFVDLDDQVVVQTDVLTSLD